jgi:hemolysin III
LRGGAFVKLLFLRRYRAYGFDITPGFVRSFEQTLALAKWPGKFEPENKESPMTESTLDRCRTNEEAANSITHAVGMVLAMAATALLTILAGIHGSTRAIVSGGIFGATLILLYTTSTLYHSARNPRSKTILQTLDHCAIFLLIAGTYTPFAMVTLHGPWGWSLLTAIWAMAIFGIVFEMTRWRRHRMVSLGLYLGMGWAVVAVIKPLQARIEPGGLILLLAGGIAYTAGVFFYVFRKIPYHHAIWHLFVLAGSTLHFFAILFFVIA